MRDKIRNCISHTFIGKRLGDVVLSYHLVGLIFAFKKAQMRASDRFQLAWSDYQTIL